MEAEGGVRPAADGDPDGTVVEEPAEPGADPRSDRAIEPANGALTPNERCAHHPGRPAVARCDDCGEPVCLACAVPVRGRVLGPGCVAAELGDPALVPPPDPDRTLSWPAVAGAVVALVGTVGPWTRTGAGDRPLGAWVPDLRWSVLAAAAALALIPVAWWARSRPGRRARALVATLGLIVLIGSALAIVFPPTFQAASWGPWVSAAGGAIAAAGALGNAIAERRSTQGV